MCLFCVRVSSGPFVVVRFSVLASACAMGTVCGSSHYCLFASAFKDELSFASHSVMLSCERLFERDIVCDSLIYQHNRGESLKM